MTRHHRRRAMSQHAAECPDCYRGRPLRAENPAPCRTCDGQGMLSTPQRIAMLARALARIAEAEPKPDRHGFYRQDAIDDMRRTARLALHRAGVIDDGASQPEA